MKKNLFKVALLVLSFFGVNAQTPDTLHVNYYENFPFAYSEDGNLVGIEIDIVKEYVNWMKQKKGLNLVVDYRPYKEFSSFYNSIKAGGSKQVGLGSVTASNERETELQFSSAYMQNFPVLVSAGTVPTIKQAANPEVANTLSKLSAVVVKGSSHENYWAFLKKNTGKYLKIQKAFSQPKEYLGLIMPKNSLHAAYINEFFESGFGFTATRAYHQILEKYLGYEILDSVELK